MSKVDVVKPCRLCGVVPNGSESSLRKLTAPEEHVYQFTCRCMTTEKTAKAFGAGGVGRTLPMAKRAAREAWNKANG